MDLKRDGDEKKIDQLIMKLDVRMEIRCTYRKRLCYVMLHMN